MGCSPWGRRESDTAEATEHTRTPMRRRLQVVGQSMPFVLTCSRLPLYQWFSKHGLGTNSVSTDTEPCTFSGPAQQVRGIGVEQPSSGDHLGSTLPFTMEAGRLSQDSPDFLQQTWAGDTARGRGSGKAFTFSTVREQQGCCRLPSALCPQASQGTTAIWRPGSHRQHEDDGAGRHRAPGPRPSLSCCCTSPALPSLDFPTGNC